jgi:hypothetical protein
VTDVGGHPQVLLGALALADVAGEAHGADHLAVDADRRLVGFEPDAAAIGFDLLLDDLGRPLSKTSRSSLR